MLALAGGAEKVEADAHVAFDDLWGPPKKVQLKPSRSPQDREERMRIVAQLAR